MFARETSEPLASLVKKIDAKISENSKLKSFLVVLTPDGDETKPILEKLAAEHGIKNVPLTMIENPAGPDSYKIAKNADVTVMMWKGSKVRANFVFEPEKLDDKGVDTILTALPKILGDNAE